MAEKYQFQLLFGCGCVCILLAIFILAIKFHSFRKKKALLKIEFGVALLLFADSLAYIYRGVPTTTGGMVTRITNFIMFAITLGNIYFINEYNVSLFMETGKFKKLPKRLLLGFILPCVGLTLLVISQFTGMYYYFDENNCYVRGPLFALSYVIPFATLVILGTFVIEHRDMIRRGVLLSLILYCVLPFAAAIAQFFLYGLSLLNLATFVAAVAIFAFALLDQNTEMSRAANTEMATGLPNAYGYVYEVGKVIEHHNITFFNSYYFDIVHMGQINNKYGKDIGDKVILQYANILRKSMEEEEILGRLGGNYFVALVKKSNAEKFLTLLSDVPVEIDFDGKKETIHVAAIAGGYEIKSRTVEAGKILGYCADALTYAKYVAKVPYVYMNEELQQKIFRAQELEDNIRKALSNNEFEPFYQPKVNTKINALHGAEALARWRHDGKMISPSEFVPIMERTGLVCDLDFAILKRVCRDQREWIEAGLTPVRVSVNFSRRNLGTPNLAKSISDIVEMYDVPKTLIQVEITETLDEYPLDVLAKFVDELHYYGITAAIDDFGTGSSSINLMKSVQFDVLKIDKSLADYHSPKEKQLLKDIIRMAQNIDMDVVAEGIEDLDQVEELKNAGCYEIQGYVFDKPLEKAEFERRMQL